MLEAIQPSRMIVSTRPCENVELAGRGMVEFQKGKGHAENSYRYQCVDSLECSLSTDKTCLELSSPNRTKCQC